MPTSSKPSSVRVDLRLQPSTLALRWLFLLHAAPLLFVAISMREGWAMLFVAAAFAGSWMWLRRHPAFGYGPRALSHLLAHDDGRWDIADLLERYEDARLDDDSVVTARLLVLHFRLADGRRRHRCILGDEAEPEALRRLHAFLRAPTTCDASRDAPPP